MNDKRYREIEVEGKQLLPSELREGWHYCAEFDDMLVGPTMQAWDACMCWPKRRISSKRINEKGVEIYEGMFVRDNEAFHRDNDGVRLLEVIGFEADGKVVLKRTDRRFNEQMIRKVGIGAFYDFPSKAGFTIVSDRWGPLHE